MRNFYIFSINKEIAVLAKESPYMLYKSFENIYNSNKSDLVVAQNLYEQVASKLNQNIINQKIFAMYKDNDFYYLANNIHSYYNKYRDETQKVIVKNSFLHCITNINSLILLKPLTQYSFFVCDFTNKDYFWLDEMCC